jgi:hypothetical protein
MNLDKHNNIHLNQETPERSGARATQIKERERSWTTQGICKDKKYLENGILRDYARQPPSN